MKRLHGVTSQGQKRWVRALITLLTAVRCEVAIYIKLMNFAFKMMNFALKVKNFVFKMMILMQTARAP